LDYSQKKCYLNRETLFVAFSTPKGGMGKTAVTMLTASYAADSFLETSETPVDVVFFDLPSTVNAKGIFKSIINMDYIFTPKDINELYERKSQKPF
jgi:hypothetical protein